MKRILSWALALVMMVVLLPITAAAATVHNGNIGANITWTLDTGTGVLEINGSGAMDDLSFDFINSPWYDHRTSIREVRIANGITRIGDNAFYRLSRMTKAVIPNSVTVIGDSAFSSCAVLADITIPNSVTTISRRAFSGTALPIVTIPASVTYIGFGAFFNNNALTTVNIGAGAVNIGDCAFGDTPALTSISVDANNPNYSSENGVFFNKNKTTLIQYPAGKTNTTYTIPASVTTIDDEAFAGAAFLTSMNIPDHVTSVGEWAFADCTSLVSVVIGSGITVIEEYTFDSCTSLRSVVIGNNVTLIREGAFAFCKSLNNVIIPDSVTAIRYRAFAWCDSLTGIAIPPSVTSFSSQVFRDAHPNFTIFGTPGSEAEKYAIEYDHRFAQWTGSFPASASAVPGSNGGSIDLDAEAFSLSFTPVSFSVITKTGGTDRWRAYNASKFDLTKMLNRGWVSLKFASQANGEGTVVEFPAVERRGRTGSGLGSSIIRLGVWYPQNDPAIWFLADRALIKNNTAAGIHSGLEFATFNGKNLNPWQPVSAGGFSIPAERTRFAVREAARVENGKYYPATKFIRVTVNPFGKAPNYSIRDARIGGSTERVPAIAFRRGDQYAVGNGAFTAVLTDKVTISVAQLREQGTELRVRRAATGRKPASLTQTITLTS
jgi:hypothetical protein